MGKDILLPISAEIEAILIDRGPWIHEEEKQQLQTKVHL
jgi:hypothetical protein